MTPDQLDHEIRKLHAMGLTDPAISERLPDVPVHRVRRRRVAMSLGSNHNPAAAGRKGAAASPYAAAKKPKARRAAGRVERVDICKKCGMPFSVSAPAAVVKRLHRRWLTVHLCEAGLYEGVQ